MKSNCNKCPEPQLVPLDPCDRSNHIIKQFIDDCSGRPVDPMTSASAVMADGCLSVLKLLNDLNALIEALSSKVDSIEEQTIDTSNDNSLKTRLLALSLRISQIEGSLGNLSDIASLRARIAALEDLNTELFTKLDSLYTIISTNSTLFTRAIDSLDGCCNNADDPIDEEDNPNVTTPNTGGLSLDTGNLADVPTEMNSDHLNP